jgi:hypothetical protein
VWGESRDRPSHVKIGVEACVMLSAPTYCTGTVFPRTVSVHTVAYLSNARQVLALPARGGIFVAIVSCLDHESQRMRLQI